MKSGPIISGVVVLGIIIAAAIFYLQNFDAGKIACEDIPAARAELQAQYKAGVDASVALYKEERAAAEERLNRCLRAEPADPCADEQSARDAAYKGFFAITSPPDNAPYADFQEYYKQRDDAYNTYKTAKAALDQCRAANPPKLDVPYEESDTKACFDEYDAADKVMQDKFDSDTQAMRSALNSALAALDAREKACHPPQGDERFSVAPGTGVTGEEDYSANIQSCRLIDSDTDPELAALRQRAADITTEMQSIDTTIANAGKRESALQDDLSKVDTYIPPESSKTQFEGALNALRGKRKVSLESALDYYQKLTERKQAEKATLQNELNDVQTKIAARLSEIQKENQAREQKYPTAIHQAPPDECDYYHCHGIICGIPDPDPHKCGQGTTDESDTDCSAFLDAYLKAAGAN